MRHTIETLEAMYKSHPKNLDVVAHSVAFPKDSIVGYFHCPVGRGYYSEIPNYSESLDSAAILVQEASKDKYATWASHLMDITDSTMLAYGTFNGSDGVEFDHEAIHRLTTASAKERTMAAILALQKYE